jgi:AcrR family transcriptional regulator
MKSRLPNKTKADGSAAGVTQAAGKSAATTGVAQKQKVIFRPHYSTTTDARVVQTREALRQALLALLAHKPFEQITIREITAAAGVGYTTFFRHHPGKEELLNDIAADEIKHLIELALPVFTTTDTKAAALTFCKNVAEHRVLWATLLTGGAARVLREEFMRLSGEIATTWNAGSDWLPTDAGIILSTSGTIELLTWWLKQKKPISVEKLAIIYERVVVAPVVSSINDN